MEPLPSAHRQILGLLEDGEHGLPAKGIGEALGTGTENRHDVGARARLKRLVSHGILTEPEPGLFTMPRRPLRPQVK